VDRVIPWVATRQWVLTVPFKRRWLLARRTDLVDGVLRVALRRITRWYRKATGRPLGKSGAVTSVQRFGSALNLNVHFHIIHLDGVYDAHWGATGVRARLGADDALRFCQATPTNEDIEALAVDIASACERWLSARGFSGEAHDDDPDVGEDDAQGLLQLASLMGMSATGERAGKKARRTQRLGGREMALGPRCAAYEGYEPVGRTRCERVVRCERSGRPGAAVPLRPATGRLGRSRWVGWRGCPTGGCSSGSSAPGVTVRAGSSFRRRSSRRSWRRSSRRRGQTRRSTPVCSPATRRCGRRWCRGWAPRPRPNAPPAPR